MKEIEKEQLISLHEAAELCPHSQEYLSLRARQKKLRAVKVERTWFTTKAWLGEYISREFLSLQVAAKISSYSQEYLSLRARQGKLKAVKIGRNWSTTKEWLKAYVDQVEGYKDKISVSRFMQSEAKIASTRKLPNPPENLPIEETFAKPILIPALVSPKISFTELFKLTSAFAVVLVLLGFTSVLSRDSLQEVSRDISPIMEYAVASATSYLPDFEFGEVQNFAGSVGGIGGSYIAWLHNTFSGMVSGIATNVQSVHTSITQRIRSLGERFGDRFATEKPRSTQEESSGDVDSPTGTPQVEKRGLVVVPSTEDNEKVKEQVKQSFSDEVVVVPHDDESGIITPVFREREGSDFFYILVPLQDAK